MIKEFQGQYRWLSNFWPVAIMYGGDLYPSVEHAYQAQKSDDPKWRARCSDPRTPAGKIKKESKTVHLDPYWDGHKLRIMHELVTLKFSNRDLREKLLATGDQETREGNSWGDTFWGVDAKTGQGDNHLGDIIMRVRAVLQAVENDIQLAVI